MKWTKKLAQIRTRNFSMVDLERMGGCFIIEGRWYNNKRAHFVMDSLGDVYLYKPKTRPAVELSPKERIGGNRGSNDTLPRIIARDGEMVKQFHSNLRPLGVPNKTNTETRRDKALEIRVGHAIAAWFTRLGTGGTLTYVPSLTSDGHFIQS